MNYKRLLLPILLGLAGCSAQIGGPPLISGRSPAGAQSASSEPQPPGSLPPGAAGLPSGPNSKAPNFASLTFRSPL